MDAMAAPSDAEVEAVRRDFAEATQRCDERLRSVRLLGDRIRIQQARVDALAAKYAPRA